MTTDSSGFAAKQQKLARLIDTGKTGEARELASMLARKYRGDATAQYALAGMYARLQQLDEVITCCRRVTELQPAHSGAHYNLAVGLLQKGCLEEAASSLERCLAIEPRNAAALSSLGRVLGKLGRHEKAVDYLEKAIQIAPDSPDDLFLLGVQLQAIGWLQGAADAYHKAVQLRPDFFEARNNLGHIFTELGELNSALAIFESLSAAKPGSVEVLNNIGVVYDSMGKAQEAEAAYRKAIDINPALVETRCHLGFLLASEGRTRDALECFNANLAMMPDHLSSIAGKASALEKTGQLEEASTTIASASPGTTTNPDVILSYCTVMLRRNKTADAIKQAERLLSEGNIPAKGIVDLHFALGDLYEKNRDYARAFRHFEQANRLSPCTYVHENHVRYINNIITATGKEVLAQLPRSGISSRDFVFIVGMPRSGTSLVEQIISSHPAVFGAGELRYMGDIAASFSPPAAKDQKYPAGLSQLSLQDVEGLAMRYLRPVLEIAGESPLVTDKMPHNFLYLGLINILFPQARIIHVTRSPLDNCLSLYFHGFNPMHSYTTDMQMLGNYYREYQRLMSHWSDVLDIPVMNIRYEDIVDNLEQSARGMLAFCGLDWSDNCLNFHENRRFVKTPSYDQVRQPIYTGSVNRWMNYREFIAPLESSLRQVDTGQDTVSEYGNTNE